MLFSLFSIILIIFFSLVPLLIWGYGNIYLSDHIWNRARFFAGIGGWIISVSCIFFFKQWLMHTGYAQIWAVIWVFLVLGAITWSSIMYGSPYIRGFLRRTLFFHIGLFSVILYGWGYLREYLPMDSSSLGFFAGISGFFIAASLEEGVKHLSSIWLTAKNFRFSRTDFLVFTFFITLGFVSAENILYLREAYPSGIFAVMITGVSRIFFALPLHVFAASICVIFWWKALSYRFFSWRYIFFFSSWFIIAIMIHSLYNLLIEKNSFLLLIIFVGIGYMTFTQWILSDTNSRKKSRSPSF